MISVDCRKRNFSISAKSYMSASQIQTKNAVDIQVFSIALELPSYVFFFNAYRSNGGSNERGQPRKEVEGMKGKDKKIYLVNCKKKKQVHAHTFLQDDPCAVTFVHLTKQS